MLRQQKQSCMRGTVLFSGIWRLGGSLAFYVLAIFIAGCSGPQKGTIILEGGQYFNGRDFVPFREIVIRADTIFAINNRKTFTVGERVDVKGNYIIPGLIDAHVHLSGSPTMRYELAPPKENARSSLWCGVTTNVDLFFEEFKCATFKKYTALFPEKYATALMAGPIITAPGGHGTEYGVPTRTITTVPGAINITNSVINNGANVIKVVYEAHTGKNAITKDMLAAIVRTAHTRQKKVFVHINSAVEAMDCIDVGADVLAHLPMDPLSDGQMQRLKKSGIVVVPTMSVMVSMFEGQETAYFSDLMLWRTAFKAYLQHFDSLSTPAVPYPSAEYSSSVWHNMRQCVRYNIPILAGTDAGNFAVFYGYSLHWELVYYVRAGMTPAKALDAATASLQKLLPGIKTGVIRPGYSADLVILDKNPLEDINHTRSIKSVYHKGKVVTMP